jgi:hypothetical protein
VNGFLSFIIAFWTQEGIGGAGGLQIKTKQKKLVSNVVQLSGNSRLNI